MKLFIIVSIIAIIAIILIIVYLLLPTQQNKFCKNDKTKLKKDYCDDDCKTLRTEDMCKSDCKKKRNDYCDDDCKTLRTEDKCKSDCTKKRNDYCDDACTELKTNYCKSDCKNDLKTAYCENDTTCTLKQKDYCDPNCLVRNMGEGCSSYCSSSDNSCKLPLTNEKKTCSFQIIFNDHTFGEAPHYEVTVGAKDKNPVYSEVIPPQIDNIGNLFMQQDGNLVLYDKTGVEPLWSSKSQQNKKNAPYQLVMQNDGNLVIYDKDGTSIWSTGTNGLC
jgi:hypothetical protein